MELVSFSEFDIENIYHEDELYSTHSYVILNGSKTRTIIDGIILEKCVRIYDYYLVFMTYDCPFEEGLTVSLLDKNGRALEKKDIFMAYYTDVFSDLRLYEPNVVTFGFLYKGLWRIEIFSAPRTLNRLVGFLHTLGMPEVKTYWKVSLDLDENNSFISLRVR